MDQTVEDVVISNSDQGGGAAIEAVLSTALDAVVIIDPQGAVTAWNRLAETLFGWSQEEALGRQLSELIIPAEARGAHEAGMERFLATGRAKILGKRVELTGTHKSGAQIPIELSVVLVGNGGDAHFIGFLRDLTEQKEAGAKLEQLQAEVIHLSRLGAMGSMASMLAHELNQPLAAAANYLAATQRILSASESPPAVEAQFPLQQARKAVLRAGDTIRMVRDMTSEKQSPREDHDLYQMIQETFRLLGATIPFEPQVIVTREAACARVSRVQIEHVLLNLIKNAAEALESEAKPSILVKAGPASDDQIEVRIEDNGPGIEPDIRERLFSPFNTSKAQGSGLGLSISRAIVEQHGGKIWAEDSGRGTAMCFTIPRGEVSSPALAVG